MLTTPFWEILSTTGENFPLSDQPACLSSMSTKAHLEWYKHHLYVSCDMYKHSAEKWRYTRPFFLQSNVRPASCFRERLRVFCGGQRTNLWSVEYHYQDQRTSWMIQISLYVSCDVYKHLTHLWNMFTKTNALPKLYTYLYMFHVMCTKTRQLHQHAWAHA